MATTPQHTSSTAARPAAREPEPEKKEPEKNEKKGPEEKVVAKEEVKALFQAGHRLKKKGAPANEWIAATRLHDVLCLAQPLTEELEKKVLGEDLVLVPE